MRRFLTTHYLSQLFPWRPNPSGKVLKTVRENFWQVPSGMARQGWTDRKVHLPWRTTVTGWFLTVTAVKREFSRRLFCFRRERVFPLVTIPSGKVQTYPISYSTVWEGWNLPCRPSPVREGSNLLPANHHQGNHNFNIDKSSFNYSNHWLVDPFNLTMHPHTNQH